jgi:hypothetical protein
MRIICFSTLKNSSLFRSQDSSFEALLHAKNVKREKAVPVTASCGTFFVVTFIFLDSEVNLRRLTRHP